MTVAFLAEALLQVNMMRNVHRNHKTYNYGTRRPRSNRPTSPFCRPPLLIPRENGGKGTNGAVDGPGRWPSLVLSAREDRLALPLSARLSASRLWMVWSCLWFCALCLRCINLPRVCTCPGLPYYLKLFDTLRSKRTH